MNRPPTLVIHTGETTHTVEPHKSTVTIGRDEVADVRIDDPRISRTHIRIEARDGQWVALDEGSLNGLFVGDIRQSSAILTDGTAVTLGGPAGVEISFELAPTGDLDDDTTTYLDPASPEADDDWTGEVDPGIECAGAAAAARRRELDIAQRSLARDKIINAGALIAFEKGRSWPREQTRRKLEEVLQWPPGTIDRIRQGATPPATDDDITTTYLAATRSAPLIVQAIHTATNTLKTAVASLPAVGDPAFAARAAPLLADLRQLEGIATTAARDAGGTTQLTIALSTIRRLYGELMTRAADSPNPTLGQRLYAARRRADLTVNEIAAAAGLPASTITAVENDAPVPPAAITAIESIITQLPR
jgi:transcriptional regulator with XRE-family HTH domain